jgi:hypothetical protein
MGHAKTKLLMDEVPLFVLPHLAETIGLKEAIILQQLHYWLLKSRHFFDGKPWIYNTIDQWHEQFPFLSVNTIRRTLKGMEKAEYIQTGNFNKKRYDKTRWYTINYDRLPKMGNGFAKTDYPKWADGCDQNGHMDVPNLGKPIPESTIDNTDSDSPKTESSPKDNLLENQSSPSPLIQFKQWWISAYKQQVGQDYLFSHGNSHRGMILSRRLAIHLLLCVANSTV